MKTVHWNLAVLISFLLWCACQSNKSDTSSEEVTLTLPYTAVVDNNKLHIEKNPEESPKPLNKEELREALNIKYPDIQLQVSNQHQDTLDIKIEDATALTQKYGTTGALVYLAEATYAFTTLPGIKVVNFDFKEGDHAVPGPHKREDFEKGL